ncbi:MAG: peptide chain release factor-like protein [Planctomycetes bacterium]|nr:peptide chain release factor-like protein [Planctomycetota bacterium]
MTAAARDALIEAPDDVLLRQLHAENYRASGPGGQHRNKVETGVRLRHAAAGVVVTASERRSQHENRHRALGRMREALATQVRCPAAARREELPAEVLALLTSQRWPSLSPKSQGFWRLAARVLDRLAADGARLSDTAAALGVSTGSLTKFLGRDDTLWQAACRIRKEAGLSPLRK